MIEPKLKALLVTIRAACIMISKAIEAFLKSYEAEVVKVGPDDSVTGVRLT